MDRSHVMQCGVAIDKGSVEARTQCSMLGKTGCGDLISKLIGHVIIVCCVSQCFSLLLEGEMYNGIYIYQRFTSLPSFSIYHPHFKDRFA